MGLRKGFTLYHPPMTEQVMRTDDLPAAGQGAIAHARWVEAPLVLLADLRSLSLPLREVRLDLRLVTEVVRDDRVSIGQGD